MKFTENIINYYLLTLCCFILSIITGCTTTSTSVIKPDAAMTDKSCVFVVGSCKLENNRATEETCIALKDQVGYGLMKQGVLEKSGKKANREVNLTITSFRNVKAWTRGFLGVMSGQDGLYVKVEVIDKESGNIIKSAIASSSIYSAVNSTERSMVRAVSNEIIDYLTVGEQ